MPQGVTAKPGVITAGAAGRPAETFFKKILVFGRNYRPLFGPFCNGHPGGGALVAGRVSDRVRQVLSLPGVPSWTVYTPIPTSLCKPQSLPKRARLLPAADQRPINSL